MNSHDRVRAERASQCRQDDLESLAEAITALQSTDDPSLVPQHDALMKRYLELKSAHEPA